MEVGTASIYSSIEQLERLLKSVKRDWIVLFHLPHQAEDGTVKLGISFGQSVLCTWSRETGETHALAVEVPLDVANKYELAYDYPWKIYLDSVHFVSKRTQKTLWSRVAAATLKAIDAELQRNGFVIAKPCMAFYEMSREERQAKNIEFVEEFNILEGRSVEEILVRGDLDGKED